MTWLWERRSCQQAWLHYTNQLRLKERFQYAGYLCSTRGEHADTFMPHALMPDKIYSKFGFHVTVPDKQHSPPTVNQRCAECGQKTLQILYKATLLIMLERGQQDCIGRQSLSVAPPCIQDSCTRPTVCWRWMTFRSPRTKDRGNHWSASDSELGPGQTDHVCPLAQGTRQDQHCQNMFQIRDQSSMTALLAFPVSHFSAHLCQLPNHSITLATNELLDGGVVKDGLWARAHLHPQVRPSQDLEPPVPWQWLGDNNTLGACLVVDLQARYASITYVMA